MARNRWNARLIRRVNTAAYTGVEFWLWLGRAKTPKTYGVHAKKTARRFPGDVHRDMFFGEVVIERWLPPDGLRQTATVNWLPRGGTARRIPQGEFSRDGYRERTTVSRGGRPEFVYPEMIIAILPRCGKREIVVASWLSLDGYISRYEYREMVKREMAIARLLPRGG